MTRLTLYAAAVLALLGSAAPARAADKALVAEVDKDLAVDGDHYDERAVLAALLARPAESAAFDAEARKALNDPARRKLFVQEWRGKLAAFSAAESKHPDVDMTRTYRNWTEIMSAEQRAYTAQRMLSMSADNRDKLVYYLKKLNDDLAANGGHIDQGFFSVSKRIVAGVMEQYRNDLNAYAATPQAADGRAHGDAAGRALAQDLAEAYAPLTAAVQPAPAPEAAKPPVKPLPPAKPPVRTTPAPGAHAAPAVPTQPLPPANPGERAPSGALAQAEAAARAGEGAGAVVDGSDLTNGGAAVTVMPTPAGSGAPSGLAPSGGAAPGGLTVSEPPLPGGDTDFMRQVEGMSSGKKPTFGFVKVAGAGLLGLIGGLIGFLVGGPVGAAIGAVVGAGLGYVAANALISKFS